MTFGSQTFGSVEFAGAVPTAATAPAYPYSKMESPYQKIDSECSDN